MPRSRVASLGLLRLAAGIRVLADGESVWLAGESRDEALTVLLASLPAARQYAVLPDGQVVLAGHRVPIGHLPAGDWKPLAEWLTVELPVAALAGNHPSRVAIRLVRSPVEQTPNVLLAAPGDWLQCGVTAPQVRLAQWSFAVESGAKVARVVIRGAPRPPIPGTAFVERRGIAVPAGFTWDPPLDVAVLEQSLSLSSGDLALLHCDGTYDRIPAESFVRATRGAIRLSLDLPLDAEMPRE